ncbi:MAG: arginine deiminase family protein [Vicinamibacterales bacterium]
MSSDALETWSEVDPPAQIVLKHARDAFVDQSSIEAQWRDLNFAAPPNLTRAVDEYDTFADILRQCGAALTFLPRTQEVGLDSIYVRDASVSTPRGMVMCRMGKSQRAGEPAAQRRAFDAAGIPVLGSIVAPGTLEGGDVVWLDSSTVIVGHGYRSNADGIRQFQNLLGDRTQVTVVPLPHWRGPGDVFHLMSMLSPVDHDLAVVYSRLLPVPFRGWLLDRGVQLIDVPDEEFDSMGANVLAIRARVCVMADGNPRTRRLLEAHGAQVSVYDGSEISVKGGGGPTCLSRPMGRRTPGVPTA